MLEKQEKEWNKGLIEEGVRMWLEKIPRLKESWAQAIPPMFSAWGCVVGGKEIFQKYISKVITTQLLWTKPICPICCFVFIYFQLDLCPSAGFIKLQKQAVEEKKAS